LTVSKAPLFRTVNDTLTTVTSRSSRHLGSSASENLADGEDSALGTAASRIRGKESEEPGVKENQTSQIPPFNRQQPFGRKNASYSQCVKRAPEIYVPYLDVSVTSFVNNRDDDNSGEEENLDSVTELRGRQESVRGLDQRDQVLQELPSQSAEVAVQVTTSQPSNEKKKETLFGTTTMTHTTECRPVSPDLTMNEADHGLDDDHDDDLNESVLNDSVMEELAAGGTTLSFESWLELVEKEERDAWEDEDIQSLPSKGAGRNRTRATLSYKLWLELIEKEEGDLRDEDDAHSLSPEEAVDVVHKNRKHETDYADVAMDSATVKPAASNVIEIFPGCIVPLLGSQDTIQSFLEGSAVLVPCSACRSSMFCAPSATMVLCPHCRDVSPVVPEAGAQGEIRDTGHISVGLGMSIEESFALVGR
jgi:hypothetical protein